MYLYNWLLILLVQKSWRCVHLWRKCVSIVGRLSVKDESISCVLLTLSINKDKACQLLHMKLRHISRMFSFFHCFLLLVVSINPFLECMFRFKPIGSKYEAPIQTQQSNNLRKLKLLNVIACVCHVDFDMKCWWYMVLLFFWVHQIPFAMSTHMCECYRLYFAKVEDWLMIVDKHAHSGNWITF